MPDYSTGKVYTIRCRTDDTLIYVGSTIQSLAKRWGEHKKHSRTEKCQNRVIYKTINNNWSDWYIELYEEYPCENKEQLCKREGEIMRLIGTLNRRIEGRTHKEWCEDNKDKLEEYREQHKVKNKEYYKEYHEQNKEKRLNYAKDYYEQKKGEKSQQITCECGCIIRQNCLTKHKKTKKHLMNIIF